MIPVSGGVLIDFGLGNLAALCRKVSELDPGIRISGSPEDLEQATYLLLPGVGHFARAMENLERAGLLPVLKRKVIEESTPILGICVGMQLFARHSEEGDVDGLGWIDATVRRFPLGPLKVPHIGWSCLSPALDDPLLDGIDPDQRFYFIHSYHVVCSSDRDVVARAHYGDPFVAIVRRGHIMGVQFHPEKSHRRGLRIIENFLRIGRPEVSA